MHSNIDHNLITLLKLMPNNRYRAVLCDHWAGMNSDNIENVVLSYCGCVLYVHWEMTSC